MLLPELLSATQLVSLRPVNQHFNQLVLQLSAARLAEERQDSIDWASVGVAALELVRKDELAKQSERQDAPELIVSTQEVQAAMTAEENDTSENTGKLPQSLRQLPEQVLLGLFRELFREATLLKPALVAEEAAVDAMPEGPERDAARATYNEHSEIKRMKYVHAGAIQDYLDGLPGLGKVSGSEHTLAAVEALGSIDCLAMPTKAKLLVAEYLSRVAFAPVTISTGLEQRLAQIVLHLQDDCMASIVGRFVLTCSGQVELETRQATGCSLASILSCMIASHKHSLHGWRWLNGYESYPNNKVPLASLTDHWNTKSSGPRITGHEVFHGFEPDQENLIEISADKALEFLKRVRAEAEVYKSGSTDAKRELVTASAFVCGEDLEEHPNINTGQQSERDSCVELMKRCRWFRNVGPIFSSSSVYDEDVPEGFRSIVPYENCGERGCAVANPGCGSWDGGFGRGYWDMHVLFIACFNVEQGILTIFGSTGSD